MKRQRLRAFLEMQVWTVNNLIPTFHTNQLGLIFAACVEDILKTFEYDLTNILPTERKIKFKFLETKGVNKLYKTCCKAIAGQGFLVIPWLFVVQFFGLMAETAHVLFHQRRTSAENKTTLIIGLKNGWKISLVSSSR